MAQAQQEEAPAQAIETTAPAESLQALAPPGMLELAERLRELQQSPLLKILVQLYQNPEFKPAVDKIIKRGEWRSLIFYQLAVVIFVFFLRNYEYSRLERGAFWQRIWVGIWTGTFLFTASSLIVPLAHFGPPYWTLLRVIVKTLATVFSV